MVFPCGCEQIYYNIFLFLLNDCLLVPFSFPPLIFNIFVSKSTPPNRFQDWSIIEKIMVVSPDPSTNLFSALSLTKYVSNTSHWKFRQVNITSYKKGVTGFEQLEKNWPSPLPPLLLGNSMRVNPALVV
jgi:hypothetical protein